jgi:hypothetical protein
MQIVLKFANAKISDENWREIVGNAFAPIGIVQSVDPTKSVYDVDSPQKTKRIHDKLRAVMLALVELEALDSIPALDLAQMITDRANVTVERFGWDQETGRLMPRWKTEQSSFEEGLFAHLALALGDGRSAKRTLHRCTECGNLFYDPTRRPARYCSQPCRSRGSAREFLEGITHRRTNRKRPRRRPNR